MRNSRIWVGLVLVLSLALVERLTYYGVKGPFSLFATAPPSGGGLGVAMAEAREALALLAGVGALATLAGGVVSIAVGARRLLVLSAALSALAFAALTVAAPGSLTAIVVVWAVAKGLFLANLYTVAVEQLAGARPMTLAALFASLTVAVNVGAFCGPLLTGLSRGVSFAFGFFCHAALMVIAAGATTIVFVLDRAPPPPLAAAPRPARALLLLAAVAAPLYLIAELPGASPATTSITTAMLQMAVLAGTNLLVIVTFIALAVVGSRISPLLSVGAGLLASALGGALYLGAGANAASAALSSLGANIAEPLALALIATVTPRRGAAAVFALWITLRFALTTLATIGSDLPPSWLVALGTMGCAAAGAALLARGRAIEAALFPSGAEAQRAALPR